MTRTPYFDKNGKKRGQWSKEEDNKLIAYISRYGHWNWSEIPKFAGLSRCGKSCRLRWMNYLRPNIKHGNITKDEEDSIIKLHEMFGNKWSAIAAKIPGRSDNEIKNYWNTNLRKRAVKVQSLLPTSSSESSSTNTHASSYAAQSSSSTATTEPPCSSPSNFDDGSVTLPYCFDQNAGSFWTDAFLVDVENAPMNETSSTFNLDQTSFHEMIMDDEFIWSTMNLYEGYHRQLQPQE